MKNKGITLVALVITIIILLILAGITISQLTESGLFEKVRLAKQKSEDAQIKENEILANYEKNIHSYRETDSKLSEYISSVDVKIEVISSSKVTLKATVDTEDNSKFIGYHYFVTKLSDLKNINGTVSKDDNVTINGLIPNTEYKVIVFAYDIYNNYCTSEEIKIYTPKGDLANDWNIGKYYKIGEDLFRTTGVEYLLLKETSYGEDTNWQNANQRAKEYMPKFNSRLMKLNLGISKFNSRLMKLSEAQTMGWSGVISGKAWWLEEAYNSSNGYCCCNNAGVYMYGWGTKTNNYIVRPCITVTTNTLVYGTGTAEDPYNIIDF